MGYPSTGTAANSMWQTLSNWEASYGDVGQMLTSSEAVYVGGPTGGSLSPTQMYSYGYNGDEIRNEMTLNVNGTSVTAHYGIDSLDRTTSVTQNVNGNEQTAIVNFDSGGRVSTLMRAVGSLTSNTPATTASYGYEPTDGLLISLTHTTGGTNSSGAATGSALTSFGWIYNANQRVLEKSYTQNFRNSTPSVAETYGYDQTGQLISVNSVPVNGVAAGTPSYDANGNSAGATQIGPNNELLNDGTDTYTYDTEGNRLSKAANTPDSTAGAVNDTTYAYDTRNRLISVTELSALGGTVLEQVYYNYDAFDRKVGETVTTYDASGANPVTTSTTYVYNGDQILAELNSSETVTRTNMWLPGSGQLISRARWVFARTKALASSVTMRRP